MINSGAFGNGAAAGRVLRRCPWQNSTDYFLVLPLIHTSSRITKHDLSCRALQAPVSKRISPKYDIDRPQIVAIDIKTSASIWF